MPREQVEWFKKESIHDSDKIHAQQSCTYYSIVNVNKTNHPFLSSYEQEQTWTLTRTISNNHKRYQSSIENIHLTIPVSLSKTKQVDYENLKIKKNRSNLLLPPTPKYTASTSIHPFSTNMNSTVNREQKNLPIKAVTNDNVNLKNDSNIKNIQPLTKQPVWVIHANGEFIVRI